MHNCWLVGFSIENKQGFIIAQSIPKFIPKWFCFEFQSLKPMKRDRIDVILANDIFKYQNLNPKMRKNQFEGWLYKVYDKFHNHLTKKERKCLVRKASEQDRLKITTSDFSRLFMREALHHIPSSSKVPLIMRGLKIWWTREKIA